MFFDFTKGFNDDSSLRCSRRPIIAISANIIDENSALHFAYSQALIEAQATPIIIPANCDAASLLSLMQGVDGVLLSGGADIDAHYFGQENIPDITDLDIRRDRYEFMLLRAAIDCSLPIMGICRGAQVINIALGGDIYQDLPSQYPAELLPHSILKDKHLPAHDILVKEGTLLQQIIECQRMGVNSRHHQAIDRVAPTLVASATSPDGVIEAIEDRAPHKIIAVQWHPENLATAGASPQMKRLFSHFAAEAKLYMRAKELHRHNPIVDSHCDTPMLYQSGGFDFAERCSAAQVDLVKMEQGYLDATITVAYIPQSTPIEEAFALTCDTLNRFSNDIAKLKERAAIIRTPAELHKAKSLGRKAIFIAVENGLALGDNIENIEHLNALGVTYITLCHNGSNALCDSAAGEPRHGGVSEFGERVIRRMNQLGITVDISHAAASSISDILRISSRPIIASHSSARALCDHPRNISDEHIKAIAERDGVVQVCAYEGFLGAGATLLTIIDHMEHIISLTGYNHLGIGSDFDGGGGVVGFEGANNFINLTIELLRRGHSEENVAKIMGGNIIRVITKNQTNIWH